MGWFTSSDGLNTHLIGHNGGRNQFEDMHNHDVFVVTDEQGKAFKYVKTDKYGERIVLQNTKKHPYKWIIEATFEQTLN